MALLTATTFHPKRRTTSRTITRGITTWNAAAVISTNPAQQMNNSAIQIIIVCSNFIYGDRIIARYIWKCRKVWPLISLHLPVAESGTCRWILSMIPFIFWRKKRMIITDLCTKRNYYKDILSVTILVWSFFFFFSNVVHHILINT